MATFDKSSPPADPLAEPKRMLNLLSVVPTQSGWLPSELGAILTHQLDTPLAEVVAGSTEIEKSKTVRDLLIDVNPPVALMEQLKGVFKTASIASDDLLPKEVATVLYIAIIVAGQGAGQRLTSLDNAALLERVEWASRRRWCDPMLSDLFTHAIREIKSSGPGK